MSQHQDCNLDHYLKEHGIYVKDESTVCWDEDSEQYPRNWDAPSKYYVVVVVIWLEFYMTVMSSSGAAAAKAFTEETGALRLIAVSAFISTYLLGQTIGGAFCSPISEYFGRRTIYIIAVTTFAVSSLIVASPNHIAGVFIGRFFQGVAAAIPATVTFGNVSDLFDAEVRIWIVYAYTIFGMAGLALGPIHSSYMTAIVNW